MLVWSDGCHVARGCHSVTRHYSCQTPCIKAWMSTWWPLHQPYQPILFKHPFMVLFWEYHSYVLWSFYGNILNMFWLPIISHGMFQKDLDKSITIKHTVITENMLYVRWELLAMTVFWYSNFWLYDLLVFETQVNDTLLTVITMLLLIALKYIPVLGKYSIGSTTFKLLLLNKFKILIIYLWTCSNIYLRTY